MIVADESSFSRDQAYIKRRLGPGNETDLHQNKRKDGPTDPTCKPRVGWPLRTFFESSLSLEIFFDKKI